MMINRVSFFVCLLCMALVKAKSNRIIGGDQATPGQFKYQVSVQANNAHICGGAIIGDQHILTAAHCVVHLKDGTFKQMNFQITAGSTNLLSQEGVKIDVEKIYVPMKLMFKDMNYDIAVLKLRSGLGLSCNPSLQKVDLPPNRGPSHIGETAVIAGYGVIYVETRINPDTGLMEDVNSQWDGLLKYAMVNIIRNSDCLKKNGVDNIGKNQMCGQTVQRGTHPEGLGKGDSGGPLVIGNTVIGIASQGPLGGNEKRYAAVYIKVSNVVGFITKALRDSKSNVIAVRNLHSGEGTSSSQAHRRSK